MKLPLIVALAVATTALANDDDNIRMPPLAGQWVGKEIWEGKKKEPGKITKSMSIEFGDKTFTLLRDGRKMSGSFTVDHTKTPNWINLKMTQDNEEFNIPAIFKIDDGTLMLCHPQMPGSERPSTFAVSENVVVASYEKSKKKKRKLADEKISEPRITLDYGTEADSKAALKVLQ